MALSMITVMSQIKKARAALDVLERYVKEKRTEKTKKGQQSSTNSAAEPSIGVRNRGEWKRRDDENYGSLINRDSSGSAELCGG